MSRIIALLTLALLTSACACFPCMPAADMSPSSSSMLAPVAPPPPQFEDKGQPDNLQNLIWRPGYWAYGLSDFYWVDGEWITKPAPTAAWSPDHWIKHTYGWAFVPGYWE